MKRAPSPFPRPMPPLAPDAHKGEAGRLLVVAGSLAMPGAALLVSRAAHRGGAGLVTLCAGAPNLLAAAPIASPETVLLPCAEGGEAAPEELVARLSGGEDHALVAGPGLGNSPRTRAIVEALVAADSPRPVALDADGLNALDGQPELLRAARGPWILTPHPGEAARLLGRPIPADRAGRIAAAAELAERSGAVVCLKGAGTVVAWGDGQWVNDTGNWGMATAGSGDVLSGLLGAYLATWFASGGGERGVHEVAAIAVRCHGRAGDLAAVELGERALVAGDLVDFLPAAQRDTGGSAPGVEPG